MRDPAPNGDGAPQATSPVPDPLASSPPLTVVRLEVESYQRIRAAVLRPPATGVVLVRGPNGAGKSSVIGSMVDVFRGERPPEPIQQGAHSARVLVDLGDVVVSERLTRDSAGRAKATLVVEAADGAPMRSPRAVLDAFCGHTADPGSFLAQRPAEQVKTVLHVLGLADDLARLEDVERQWYERRRDLGRDLAREEKAAEDARASFASLAEPPTAGSSLEQMTSDLDAANRANARTASLRLERAAVEREGADLRARIEALEAELVKLSDQRAKAAERWSKLNAMLAGAATVDTAPLVAAISAHEARVRWEAKRDYAAEKDAAATRVRAEHDQAEAGIEEAREAIVVLLARAPWPVSGMLYDPATRAIAVGGVPFAQASQGERLEIAAAVAMAGNPRVRVLFVREASLWDRRALARLDEIARDRGFQVWAEYVDTTRDGVGFYVEDGEVWACEGGEV